MKIFFENMLSTLGIGIGTFMTYALIAVIGIIIIMNYEFFFSFLRAIGDWIVFQLSKIPLFANGIYLSMIKRTKASIKNARDLQAELEGKKQELCQILCNNEEEYSAAIKRARFLKSQQRLDEALSCIKKAKRLEKENIDIKENQIPSLECSIKAAEEKIAELTEEVDKLKHDRKSADKVRKTLKVLEKANTILIGDNTDSDAQILENYQDHLKSRRFKAQGTETILAKSPKAKQKALDDDILSLEAKEFLEKL